MAIKSAILNVKLASFNGRSELAARSYCIRLSATRVVLSHTNIV